ncbi:hypothetical protein EV702DRAFT_349051 [Suillus placidus]|uniref:Uncharacterized protein n=1 Tax=Suillus placidus TaxID=48579 RepID=A0A9P7D1V0_9AGAM|nr:hypothetical protein EV702DRAFT_349051 [Suillus placidus]
MSRASSLVALALAFPFAVEQDLNVPSAWRVNGTLSFSCNILIFADFRCTQDPSTSLSFLDRVSVAQNCTNSHTAVLDTGTNSFSELGSWRNANVAFRDAANIDYRRQVNRR